MCSPKFLITILILFVKLANCTTLQKPLNQVNLTAYSYNIIIIFIITVQTSIRVYKCTKITYN